MSEKESPWLREVRKTIGARPDILAHRQHAGTYCPPNEPKVFIKVAPDGIADIMGVQIRKVMVAETVQPNGFQPHERIVPHFYGQAIAIETKSARGQQELSQKKFQRAWEASGGLYIKLKPGDWEPLWDAIGIDVDEDCAEEAQRRFRVLTHKLGLDKTNEPRPQAKRRKKRRPLKSDSAALP